LGHIQPCKTVGKIMIKFFKFFGSLVLGFVSAIAVILGTNYLTSGVRIQKNSSEHSRAIESVITIFNWNIGYAGLGKESDFIMDGGENLLPPSKEIVEKNVAGIAGILKSHPSDFYIIQEVSKPDMLNLGVDVLGGVRDALPDHSSWFTYDFNSHLIPTKWALKHGLSTFMPFVKADMTVRRLPNEPDRIGGIIQRQYHIQVTEFSENDREWALLNIHLSAFDEGGNIRVQQFERLLEIAGKYYAQGKHVVIGGDWNMQLTLTDFPNTTKEEDLFWLKKLPVDKLPEGWQLVFDSNIATIRTNERPYVKGENYTTIIDGFLVSPNVDVLSISGIDTNFEYTDHQPVMAKFQAR